MVRLMNELVNNREAWWYRKGLRERDKKKAMKRRPTACPFDILLLVPPPLLVHTTTATHSSQHVYLSTRGGQEVLAARGTFLGPSKTLHHSPADLAPPSSHATHTGQ